MSGGDVRRATHAPANGPADEPVDAAFLLAHLDPAQPANAATLAAAEAGDDVRARSRFADAVRAALRPERYLSLPLELGDDAFMGDGETLAQAAERIVEGERISVGVPHRFGPEVDWHANPTPEGYREWTWQLNRHREWVVLAEAYLRSGDGRFARRIVADLRGWRAQAPVPNDAPGDATRSWRTIEAGIRAGATWPRALHALMTSDALSDDVLAAWAHSFWQHGMRLRRRHRTGNWLAMEMNGLAHVGILFPIFHEAASWRDYALATLVRELGVQVHPDGFQYELSTHTHQILLRQYTRVDELCRAYDVPVPDAFHDALERIHGVNLRLAMPDGRLPNLNNGAWHDVAGLLGPATKRYPERADFLWGASRGTQGTPPERTTVHFPYAGYAVFRSDWSASAVWALFDGGPYGFRHHHEDKLNLLVHAYGRLLLTEAGKFRFDGSPMYRYTLDSRGHNTVLVDGHGQNRKARFVPELVDAQRPAGLHLHTGPRVDAADAVYDEGYGPEADTSVVHARRVFFLRDVEGLPPLFVVVDRLRVRDGGTHRYEAQWHLATRTAEATGTAAHTHDPGRPNLSLTVSGPEPLRLVEGETDPSWRGWRVPDEGAAVPTPCPTVLVSWHGGASRRLVAIEPRRPESPATVRGIAGSEDPAASTFDLQLADGTSVRLDERTLLEGDR